jgi:hypothetical protein
MRKLVVTENITLEGVIDASEGWFAPAEGRRRTRRLQQRPTMFAGKARRVARGGDIGRRGIEGCGGSGRAPV